LSEGFLSRWSRRKQALARGEEVVEPPPAPGPVPPPASVAEAAPDPPALAEAAPVTPPEPEPELDLSSLPDIETLDAATDIRAFFQKGVPEALRNAALRKAYATDPVISSYMGPLDYAWDFNTPGGLPYGFASELGEVGEKLRQLIAQAVGEPPLQEEADSPEVLPDESAPSTPLLAEVTPPGEGGREVGDEAELSPPEAPVRLAAAAEEGAPIEEALPAAASDAAPLAPRRRHGGALPV
jgi:hypothetical protein